ncbi:L-lactate dehydrogenase [Castellaniella hirudinis]|uniref:alpha-hydroxy acid oxidase n=1 Tax=Castellaniella hirudinis TaxID=1144617 RepID=UPI0039C2F1AF
MPSPAQMTCTEDFRRLAQRRVPRMFYDYVDSGSWTESTYRDNALDLQKLKFRQRVAVDIAHRTIGTTLLGEPAAMPVALAPTGMTGMQWADGEILAAQAAEQSGIPFSLSTVSICSIEDVAAHTQRPFWFQLYVMRDRAFIRDLIERAKAAACAALIVTLDLQVVGQRHKDIKNGLSTPPRPTLKNLIDLATKLRWCKGMMGTRRHGFGNIIGHAKGVKDVHSLTRWSAEQFDPTLSWKDLEWIKQCWGGKLVVKGILDADDARLAVAAGADAIIVSNHGGRQLDGAPSTISVLPSIVQAVGTQVEVLMDGGVTSGQDVLRAVALGARGVLIGRAFLYALGAMGRPGVSRCLELIAKELDVSMAFCGKTTIADVDRSILVNPDILQGG